MSRLASLLILVALLTTPAVAAQAPVGEGEADPEPYTLPRATVQEWQGYALTWRNYNGGTRSATATIYGNTSRFDAEEHPYTVVLMQGEGNGAPLTEDAKFLAEIVGRDLGVSPTRLAFLFRFAVEGADLPLTIRATFRRSSSGGLVSPSWRVLSAEEVEDYTDRQLRTADRDHVGAAAQLVVAGAEPPPRSADGSADPEALRAWADVWIPRVCIPMRHPGNHRYLHALRVGVLGDRAEREARPHPKLNLFGQAH